VTLYNLVEGYEEVVHLKCRLPVHDHDRGDKSNLRCGFAHFDETMLATTFS
jgi:hypothetical protein